MAVAPPRIVCHRCPHGSWEMATRAPDPRLAAYVRPYAGYVERPRRGGEAAG
jgi:hypothetical protein